LRLDRTISSWGRASPSAAIALIATAHCRDDHPHHAPLAARLRVGYIQRMPDLDLKPAVAQELYQALEKLGASPALLGVIASWGDTYTDADVLDDLRRFNAQGTIFDVVERRALRCSFCRKRQRQVGKLIAGPGRDLFICDRCVVMCMEIVEKP
jgi:hypothetical protein